VGGQRHASVVLPPGKTRYPLYRRLGGLQGRSKRVRKISPPTGIRSPDRPARNESLYRLSCRGPLDSVGKVLYFPANLAERTNISCRAIGLLLCLTLSSGCRWLGVSFVRHRTHIHGEEGVLRKLPLISHSFSSKRFSVR
jgi:hypothetical protein